MKKIFNILLIIILILIFIFFISLNLRIYNYNLLKYKDYKNFSLNNEGVKVIKNILSDNDLEFIHNLIKENNYMEIKKYITNNSNILEKIKLLLGENYMFQDYILTIKKSQIHICHRDNNGTFYNPNLKYPSYTVIFYLEDMKKCLDVIPYTHINKYNNFINFTDQSKSIICNKGDCIIFNANLIHSGSLNNKENNLRLQFKISHKDDIETLKYYQKYYKILDKDNFLLKILKNIHKHLSCQFPFISDLSESHAFNAIDNKNYNIIHKLFSLFFYGDSSFYNLKSIK